MKAYKEKIIESIKKKKLPVIIFGAATVGEALFYACCQAGIKVECFCDNNTNKTKSSLRGLEVVCAKKLKERYQNAFFLISVADIQDVVKQLNVLGYDEWSSGNFLLRDFDIFQYQFRVSFDFVRYTIDTCLLCHDNYLIPNKIFLRSVDLIITERCSLRCRDCSNLMQYYRNPKNCEVKEIMHSVDKFFSFVDEINEFRVIGGEPFMNQKFNLIIEKLNDESKVKKIIIYTNGTIIPQENQIECLKNNKVLIIITNYGVLSKNFNTLIQKLTDCKVAFYAEKACGWTNCAGIKKHNRSGEQQKEIFRNCCAKNLTTLSDGKLYRCPFAANIDRLQAIPNYQNDCANLFSQEPDSKIKEKIKSFLFEKEFFQVCDYCNGRSFDSLEIMPAIQIDKPLEYKSFS